MNGFLKLIQIFIQFEAKVMSKLKFIYLKFDDLRLFKY